jgi:uncharacterized protein (DUF4415 family)
MKMEKGEAERTEKALLENDLLEEFKKQGYGFDANDLKRISDIMTKKGWTRKDCPECFKDAKDHIADFQVEKEQAVKGAYKKGWEAHAKWCRGCETEQAIIRVLEELKHQGCGWCDTKIDAKIKEIKEG